MRQFRPRNPDELVNLQLRLPEWLRAYLAKSAEANYRSMNGEIVWLLTQIVEAEKFQKNLEKK